jgi:hypothetical protein
MLHSIILYTKRTLGLSFEHVVAMAAFIEMKRLHLRPVGALEPTVLTLRV